MSEQKLNDALDQVAAETLRADQAESDAKAQKTRADTAEAQAEQYKLELDKLRKERADVDVEKMQRQIKVLQSNVTAQKARADKAESPDTIRAKVQARVALERKAADVIGADAKFDAMDDRALMGAVIERLCGVSVEGRSDEYVKARFDAAVESFSIGSAQLERVRQAAEDRTERSDNRTARDKFIERERNAWRPAAE
jgi:hypothetical protein